MDREKKKTVLFGLGLGAALVIAGLRCRAGHGPAYASGALFSAGIALTLLSIFRQAWLAPVQASFMKAVNFAVGVITFFVLSVIYFLVFGTAGLILKIFRKDLLDLHVSRGRASYWQDRRADSRGKERYRQQY